MKILRDDLELRRKQELHETEERKNAHIRELMRKHRQVLSYAELCIEFSVTIHQRLLILGKLSFKSSYWLLV